MAGLEDAIDQLLAFDQLREEAAKLHQEAIEVLGRVDDPKDHARGRRRVRNLISQATALTALQDAVRLGARHDATNGDLELLGNIDSLSLSRLLPDATSVQNVQDADQERIPLFVAARVLQALLGTPGYGLSRPALCCYYRILRELYTPGPPDFTAGGIRAGEHGSSTAFMTGECARALLSLCNMLAQTADFLDRVHVWKRARDRALHPSLPKEWRAHEVERARLTLRADLMSRKRDLAFKSDAIELLLKRADVEEDQVRQAILKAMAGCSDEFQRAVKECEEARSDEVRRLHVQNCPECKAKPHHQDDHHVPKHRTLEEERTESAHLQALRGIRDGQECTRQGLDDVQNGNWEAAAKRLRKERGRIRRALRSAEYFLKGVLDRELAEALSDDQHHQCDYPELAFAAAGYGALHYGHRAQDDPETEWDDPHLKEAARLLVDRMGTDGSFPVGQPMVAYAHGYRLEVIGAEVTRAVADVLRNAEVPFQTEAVRKMLRLFWRTRDPGHGWGYERRPSPIEAEDWTTALAALALHGVVEMLDVTIRNEVLKHFTVRWLDPKGITLDTMMYGDIGLAEAVKRPSLCRCCQQLRDHLLGVKGSKADRLWSLVLHGPAGTGKTTIPEALAASTGRPLVEITPSDLVVGGEDQVERRARQVFQALSILTDAVILFDEFDSVLKQRMPGKPILNIFQFLTPGMLPKLKALNKAARDRRVVYFLATNLIGDLDTAAIRDGRFDRKLGIFPPDLVSRTGRFIAEMVEFNGTILDSDRVLDRLARVIQATGQGGMTQLGKRGWFTRPDSGTEEGTPFHFVETGRGSWPEVMREDTLPRKPLRDIEQWQREWQEWAFVAAWDKRLPSNATWSTLREALASKPEVPPVPGPSRSRG